MFLIQANDHFQQVAKAHPRRQLHVVLDNYGTPSIERCGRG